MTRPEIWYPVYDRICSWHSCPKHKFWRAFVYGVINNDEKAAPSKKHTQFKTRVQKPLTLSKSKMAELILHTFINKTVKTLYTKINLEYKVEPVLSGHPQGMTKWPLNTGWPPNTGWKTNISNEVSAEKALMVNLKLEALNFGVLMICKN